MTGAAQVAVGETWWPQLVEWAAALGFSQIGVADVDLSAAEPGLVQWLTNGWHGAMDYMALHGVKRARPAELVPGTLRVVTARMDYLPRALPDGWQAVEAKPLHPRHQCSPLAWNADLGGLLLHGGEAHHEGPQFDATLLLRMPSAS